MQETQRSSLSVEAFCPCKGIFLKGETKIMPNRKRRSLIAVLNLILCASFLYACWNGSNLSDPTAQSEFLSADARLSSMVQTALTAEQNQTEEVEPEIVQVK